MTAAHPPSNLTRPDAVSAHATDAERAAAASQGLYNPADRKSVL